MTTNRHLKRSRVFKTPTRRKASGVALITVLLVVAIATMLSVSMVSSQSLNIHRATNFLDHSQAYQYALGGEELARQVLREDFEDKSKIDYLGEAWAAPMEPFEFDQGEVEIQITDLQGLINLNGLAAKDSRGVVTHERFKRLLNELGADMSFADRAADWIDEDQGTRGSGAEDYDYLGLEPAYRTPSAFMADVTELRLLQMDEETYRKVLSYVTVLPESRVPLNINTAPPAILQTIATDLSLGAAEVIAEVRDAEEGFETVEEFLQQEGITGQAGIKTEGLSVTTEYFQVDIRARYNERFSTLTSIIHRDPTDGKMRVVARNMGRRFVARATCEPGDATCRD